MSKATQATTSKPPKPDTAEHFRHNATFGHMTPEEFQAAKYRQILDLLKWTAHMAAESEFHRE
jgi:hypothetical protein